MHPPDLIQILKARKILHGIVRKTPFDISRTLSNRTGMDVFLKSECLQRTGSFKLRGAFVKIASLGEREKAQGIITASAGNHAQGVGFAAKKFGIPCRVFVPEIIPKVKLEAVREYGVDVVVRGRLYDEAHLAAVQEAESSSQIFIPSFDDPHIMAGHGTLGLEMIYEVPDLDNVLIPVGGGGLIGGVAITLKALKPEIQIVGCQSTASCAMARSLEQGRPYLSFPSSESIAEGLEGGIGELTFEVGRRLIDRMVLVEEKEIGDAIRYLLKHHRLVVEGSGAVGVAALLHHRFSAPGCKVGVVLSGGNLDYRHLVKLVTQAS
jgi:threonine dehydratase